MLKKGAGGKVAIETPSRWIVADTRTLTFYENGRNRDTITATEPLPGPVTVLGASTERAGTSYGWGPAVVHRSATRFTVPVEASLLVGAALADVVASGNREYRLTIGAVDRIGSNVAVHLRWQPPKVSGGASAPRGPSTRLAVLDVPTRRLRTVLAWSEPSDPTAVSWSAGPLAVAAGSSVLIWSDLDAAPMRIATASRTAIQALASDATGERLAGVNAEGTVFIWSRARSWAGLTWRAHPTRASAIGWGGRDDTIWTGSADGAVRQWSLDGRLLDDWTVEGEVSGIGEADRNGLIVATSGRRAATYLLTRSPRS